MTAIESATARYSRAMEELTAAGRALDDMSQPFRAEVRVVQQIVAGRYELRIEELWSKERPSRIATPRMIAMFYLRVARGMTTIEVGKYFLKDHTSVSAAVHAIHDRMSVDFKFRRDVEQLFAACDAALKEPTEHIDHVPESATLAPSGAAAPNPRSTHP